MLADSGPARRVLHVCYCCADAAMVTGVFIEGLDMHHAMTSPTQLQTQDLLGLGRNVTSGAAFVYDARGPRTSPAVEVQNWVNPLPVGTPRRDPTAVGLHALGFSVPDPAGTVRRLQILGCSVLGIGNCPLRLGVDDLG